MKDHQANWWPTDRLPTHAIQRHCLHLRILRKDVMSQADRLLAVLCLWLSTMPCVSKLMGQSMRLFQSMIHLQCTLHVKYFDWFDLFDVRAIDAINNFCCGFTSDCSNWLMNFFSDAGLSNIGCYAFESLGRSTESSFRLLFITFCS